MARFTEEERKEKTLEIANYIIDNKSSTRKAALHFGISNATVSDWMNFVLKKTDSQKFLIVSQILKQNRPKTVIDVQVRKRVITAAQLIKQGYTVEEIAKAMNVSINVINEDLQTRLKRINEELYKDIKEKQALNSSNNLKIGSAMSVENQKRDENGRFTK